MPGNRSVFRAKVEGLAGDFHCMKCTRICNYLQNSYCCEDTKNYTDERKKRDSQFLKMCYYRNYVEKILKAMLANKRVIKPNGNCFFCRNVAQHREGWCKERTSDQLYLHVLDKMEVEIDKALDRYLALRKAMRVEELRKVLNTAASEMKQAMIDNGSSESDVKLALIRQRRDSRQSLAIETKSAEDENESIRWRFTKNLSDKRVDAAYRLRDARRSDVPAPETIITYHGLQLR